MIQNSLSNPEKYTAILEVPCLETKLQSCINRNTMRLEQSRHLFQNKMNYSKTNPSSYSHLIPEKKIQNIHQWGGEASIKSSPV